MSDDEGNDGGNEAFEDEKGGDEGGGGKKKDGKRFEVKKWNAVALWAWDIVVDNCAICRNHIMDLCEWNGENEKKRRKYFVFRFFRSEFLMECFSTFAPRQALSVKRIKRPTQPKSARSPGASATTRFTFTAFRAG